MIDRKDLVIIVLACFVLAVALYPKITASQSNVASVSGYDPWIDYNDDGQINYLDLYSLAKAYGATGDPTKDVRVTNWPISRDVSVWYNRHLDPSISIWSAYYNASGFGHLHILTDAENLAGLEKITVRIRAHLWNAAHNAQQPIEVYSFNLTSTSHSRDITIPVPGETFFFGASTDATSDGYIYLSFYLTWA